MTTTDCVICMEATANYTVQCGSEIPHTVCTPCEVAWRLKSTPSLQGRFIKCPICRGVEADTSKRSAESLQLELVHVYGELAAKKPTVSTVLNSRVTNYIRILEQIAMVPPIQLNGFANDPVPRRTLSARDQDRETRRLRQETQELQRQAGVQERAAREAARRQERTAQAAAERQARRDAQAAAERQAEQATPTAVWCESGNVLLGTCPTQRRTQRACSYTGCIKRVCFRCDKCNSH